ncbi:MAG: preprotein translocase subunit SecA [Patescibacteria group bacterium]
MSFLSSLFGTSPERAMRLYSPTVEKINSYEAGLKDLPDSAFPEKTAELRSRLADGATLEDILPEAFALVREAAVRTLGQRHYDVQLIGGIVLHQGKIAEMRTGEGKTLVATLPVYLNALTKKGVHVITVNDYLARRDAVWMGQVYAFLGLSTSVLNHESSFLYDPSHKELDEKRDETASFKIVYEFMRPCTRREAYQSDITYGTNHEYGFDYLRDNLAYGESGLSQVSPSSTDASGNHHFAVVDEIDSILIDEARTPLIISAPVAESESLYKTFADIATKLLPEKHYAIDEKLRAITLTEEGIETAEKILGVDNIYTDKGIKYVHHLETAVRARALFHLDKEYVVKEGEVVIVDQSTGRLQPGRRWSEGLHQAIEAKEGVYVKEESRTYASISFQNYFRLYKKLAGMTGTALTSAEEFTKVYRLEVVPVPTHRSVARDDLDDFIFQTEMGKYSAIAKKIKEVNLLGQPVLVGTISIEKNELLSQFLSREGVKHEILNAKNHEREGEIIANAGRKGAVTIATNMAGRGVDIKLGGALAKEDAYSEVRSLGGLFVLGTERHEARRIDNQLRGRSGRQGDPGATQFFLSLEDSLMRVFASDTVKSLMGKLGIPEDEPIQNRLVSRSIESAQEKIEGFHFDARKHLLEYDDVMNHQRKIIYERRRKILLGTYDYLEEFLTSITDENDTEFQAMLGGKKDAMGREKFLDMVRSLTLQCIDMYWVEHLEAMDHLQQSVRLRAYGQRDPLVEYKREGLGLFKNLESSIFAEVVRLLPGLGVELAKSDAQTQKLEEVHAQAVLIGGSNTGNVEDKGSDAEPGLGRNDLCPCGSGKKYKHCGLKETEEHKRLIEEKA